jgi:glucose-1-phosphate cytidylyltransferase
MMKVVILAGGLGTRIGDENELRPKAMVEIDGKPIIWHLMQFFSNQGFTDFLIATGRQGDQIKRFFAEYAVLQGDLSINLGTGEVIRHSLHQQPWHVQIIDTGNLTQTGGRIKRLAPKIGSETFLLSWVDSLTTINIHDLIAFHNQHGRAATVSVVRPVARYGVMDFDGDRITSFKIQPQFDEGWMNGGFYVLEPEIFDLLADDQTVWEGEPLAALAAEGNLYAYRHFGFWYCLDTSRDRFILEKMCQQGTAPWLEKLENQYAHINHG